MKLLVEFKNKEEINTNYCDGIILGLKDYSVMNKCEYTLSEIEDICNRYKEKEIFINLNRNFFNEDIENLKEVLKEIDKINLAGIFFYDLAILQIKKELNLRVPLVWSQTHMVNNYNTCNYYYQKNVEYALLGKEITLSEIKDIINNTSIKCMVEIISKPSIAFSKRKLLSNYYKDLEKKAEKSLLITEKITKENYLVKEEKYGTGFYKDKIINGTSIIKELNDVNCEYIIIRDDFDDTEFLYELIEDTYNYIKAGCIDEEYVNKYKKLGNDTNFFFNKTIYKVKKDNSRK